jgi:hypothetical protein
MPAIPPTTPEASTFIDRMTTSSKIAVAVRAPTDPATTPTYDEVDATTGASNTMFFTVPEVTV